MRGAVNAFISVVAMGAWAVAASADIIALRDGRSISGSVQREGNTMVIRPADGGPTITTTPDQIVRVTLTSSVTPEEAAESEWRRTALLIKKAEGVPAIIALHKGFLEKFPDQKTSQEVRSSLGEYEKLATLKPVKFGGRWIPAEQIDVTLATWREQAKPALEQYRGGHMREALDLAKGVIQSHSDSADALAIAGLAAFHVNDLPAAAKYFSSLAALDPGSLLAENNLAIVASAQKLPGQALLHYATALQITPDNRLLLDNIQAVLLTFVAAGGKRDAAAYRDLIRASDAPEGRMEAEMAKKKLHRLGSWWIPVADFSRIAAARGAVQTAMRGLDASYGANREAAGSLTDEIQRVDNDCNTALANLTRTDRQRRRGPVNSPDSVAGVDPSQQALDQLRVRKQALEAQRDQLNLAAADMHAQAEKLKVQFAALQTRGPGPQRIMEIGEDKVPPAPLNPPELDAILGSVPQLGTQPGEAANVVRTQL